MQNNWKLGTLLGIPLYLDYSWFLILALVTLLNAKQIDAPGIWAWVGGFTIAILMFSSVLLHELGHSIVAIAQGIKVNSITLFLFGGVASIDRESKTPLGALLVAAAGPLVSFMLFLVFSTISLYLPDEGLINKIVSDLAAINLVLAIFNLIPGLPLDGGQILKAIVWKATGDPFTGMMWASSSGIMVGWFGILAGLSLWLLSGAFGALWLAFIGWFILRNANAYQRITTIQKTLLDLKASDVMTRNYRVIEGKLTLAEFAQQFILSENNQAFPYYAATEGRYCGLIKLSDLQQLNQSQWNYQTLGQIAHPLTEITSLGEKTPLYLVIQSLEKITEPWITILSPAGAVAGVIDRGDIVRAIALKLKIPIPDAEIKRIKGEKSYPPGFDLRAIADSLAKTPYV